MTTSMDTRPRRVWLGLTVPGKTVMQLLKSHEGPFQGQRLTALYKDDAYVALLSAALALHLMPKHGGPHGMPYGAVLGDVREFLRFRFRAEGLLEPEKRPKLEDIAEGRTEGRDTMAEVGDGVIVNYVITRLGTLAQQSGLEDVTTMTVLLVVQRFCIDG